MARDDSYHQNMAIICFTICIDFCLIKDFKLKYEENNFDMCCLITDRKVLYEVTKISNDKMLDKDPNYWIIFF